MNALWKTLALGAVAAVLAGCASPYSQLDGTRWYGAPIDTYDVVITEVDGRSTALMSPVKVEPGRHMVTVQPRPAPSTPYRKEQTIALDVEPCMHYYLVAVKPTRLSTDFEVKVDHKERITGCRPPAGG